MSDKERKNVTLEVKADEIPLATNGLDAPTFYIEDIRGAMLSQGATKLNLVEYRMDALKDELRAIHVATLILPTAKLKDFGNFFLRLFPEEEPQAEETNAAP